jgi:hypothetical protein
MGIEDPPEDVAEQHTPAMPGVDDEELDDVTREEVPWDADPDRRRGAAARGSGGDPGARSRGLRAPAPLIIRRLRGLRPRAEDSPAPSSWQLRVSAGGSEQAGSHHRGERTMASQLSGKRVAILATDGVERVEVEHPRGGLYGAGAVSDLVSVHDGQIQARQLDLI